MPSNNKNDDGGDDDENEDCDEDEAGIHRNINTVIINSTLANDSLPCTVQS